MVVPKNPEYFIGKGLADCIDALKIKNDFGEFIEAGKDSLCL